MESTTQLRTWIWHLRFCVFISNCVIAVVCKPYCHYYIWQLKHLVTSKRIKTCLVFILKGQYPMAVRCKSVSQTATSFTPKSHIWFFGALLHWKQLPLLPFQTILPRQPVHSHTVCSQLLQGHHSPAPTHRAPAPHLFLHFGCTHASAWGWPLVNIFAFPGGSLQPPCSMYLPPLTSVLSLLLNCCRPLSGLKPFTLCCQVHS